MAAQPIIYVFFQETFIGNQIKKKEALLSWEAQSTFLYKPSKLNPDKLKTVFTFHNLGSRTHALKPLSRRLNHKHKDKKMNNLPLQPKCHVFHHHWCSVMHGTRFKT